MKPLKFRFLALAAAATMLAGCAASVDANGVRNNLANAGFQVHFVAAADYTNPAAFDDLSKADGLTYYIDAVKGDKDAIFAWFFDNIDHTTAWFEANQTKLVGKKIAGSDDYMGTSQHNNCVYVYTPAADAAAKIKG